MVKLMDSVIFLFLSPIDDTKLLENYIIENYIDLKIFLFSDISQ